MYLELYQILRGYLIYPCSFEFIYSQGIIGLETEHGTLHIKVSASSLDI